MVVEIVFEMTVEYQLKKMQGWEIMSFAGLADDIRSEVVLNDEEKSWRKGGDAVNVCDFVGAVGELWKIISCFGLKGIAVADSD